MAELVDQDAAGRPVALERVGLTAATVEREHQLRVETLAQRVLADERLELGNEPGVLPEREVSVDASSSAASR